MSVISCFGEDIDFPNGVAVTVDTTAGHFRGAFARCALRLASSFSSPLRSMLFTPVTSCWVSAQVFLSAPSLGNSSVSLVYGLESDALQNSGIYVEWGAMTGTLRLMIGPTTGLTQLAESAPGTFQVNVISKVELQVVNYGANGTLNAYINGTLVASYTGDIRVAGVASFDCLTGWSGGNGANFQIYPMLSEVVIADEPTLGWQGVQTLAPNGNGATQQWSNSAYTNINPITINDANSSYTDVVDQDQQVTLSPEVAGNYQIKAVRVVSRANGPAGSVPTGISLGFNSGVAVAVGSAHAINTEFQPYSDIFANDPTTGQPWTTLAGYQLDLRSA